MSEATNNTPESGTPETPETPAAPVGSAAYTDEQLAAAFPNQDVAHVRAMLDKSAGVGVPTDPNAPKAPPAEEPKDAPVEYPKYIPEKFRHGTVEEAIQAMAEGYSVLESAAGRARAAAGNSDSGTDDPASSGSDEAAGGPDPVEAKVDLRSLESDFVTAGNKITEEMYAKAEKAGIGRDVLDTFIAGQQAIAGQLVTKVHSLVGGPENYESMLQWMVGNLPEAEVEAYDAAMGSGKEATIAVAVRGVYAAYQAAVGSDPGRRVQPTTGAPQDPSFKSKREMIDAMKDPRYQKDAAYRAEVERRIAGMKW